jgi:hypothetical protein
MAEYARVATFDADEAALSALVAAVNSAQGPPEGVPATGITVLADRSAGRVVVVTRFRSAGDLEQGAAALEAMDPPAGVSLRRVSVDKYEIVLERQAP